MTSHPGDRLVEEIEMAFPGAMVEDDETSSETGWEKVTGGRFGAVQVREMPEDDEAEQRSGRTYSRRST